MEQNLDALFAEKNEMILKGQIVEACEKFFADDAKTMDFTGALTNSRDELVAKEKGLLENMKNVNGITLHYASITGDVSFAEFTFDFDMKDGSKILWHEIIRTVWENGKVTEEAYFKGL
jgi:hypothetical protein